MTMPTSNQSDQGAPDGQLQTAAAVEAEIKRLAVLPPMEYDKVRREAAGKLDVQLKTLDGLVKDERARGAAGSRLPFTEHEPWEQAVNPAELLDEIAALILKYVILEPEQAHAAALWVAHTHLIDVAGVSPVALINAPERSCAKTLLQTILGHMAYRPLFAANASAAAIFRSIERWGVTLLIDEADMFFSGNSELSGMVNAGYKHGGVVLRTEASGDNFEPKTFSVYSAKSIAGISLERILPDATLSRGIVFNMRRKLTHEKVERFRNVDAVFNRLASQLARFAMDHAEQIRDARPDLPDELSDRAQDNWEPLLAIAMCAGDAWVQRATMAALKMSSASEAQSSPGNDLLADIKEVLSGWTKPTIRTAELIELLIADEDMGWSTYGRGKPLTPTQLAKLLGAYQIKPKTVRQPKTALHPNGSTPKGYEVADFTDAFSRYLKADVVSSFATVEAATLAPSPQVDVAATEQQAEVRSERGPDLFGAVAALLDPASPGSQMPSVVADY